MSEISSMLSTVAPAGVDLEPYPECEIYNGVMYLAAFADVKGLLGMKALSSTHTVCTPGFPKSSFRYVIASGSYGDGCNRLVVVIDKADQVVAVQLTDESPGNTRLGRHTQDLKLYNLIQNRTSGRKYWYVEQQVADVGDVIVIKCELWDQRTNEPREYTELYLPKPIAGLIAHCIHDASK